MSLKLYSNVEKLNADDVRVHQLSGDTDGIIAAYYDKTGNVSLFMSGSAENLGNIGIKTESPNEALTVFGNISSSGYLYGDGSNLIGVSGNYTPPADATFTSSVSAPALSGTHYGDGSNLSAVFDQSLNTSNNVQFNRVQTSSIVGGNYNANTLELPVGFGPALAGYAEGNVFVKTGKSNPSEYLTWKFNHDDRSLTLPSSGIVQTIDGSNILFTSSVSAPALSGTFYGDGSNLSGVIKNQYILPSSVSFTSVTASNFYGDGSNLTGVIHTQYTPPADATFTTSVSAPALSGTHYGSGTNLTNLNASSISSGTLSSARMPAFSGDITTTAGSTSAAVVKMQGYAISNQAPTVGQTLQWSGTDWVPGTIPTGGSGGGGKMYFFNYGTASDSHPGLSNTVYELGITTFTPTVSATLTHVPENTYTEVCTFITDILDPDITQIPAGLWDANIWASTTANNTTQMILKLDVYTYSTSLSTTTLIATSDDLDIYDPTVISQYTPSIIVPQTTVNLNDRIYVVLKAKATSNNKDLTLYFGGLRPSHIHTTIPSVGGSGSVFVVNGVFQSPARQIVDSDIADGAAIALSKVSGAASAASVAAITPTSIGAVATTQLGALNGVATLNGSGTLTSSQLPAIATFTASVSSAALSGTHYGDGSNLTNINATNIASGTLNNSRLPAVATFTTSVSSSSVSGTHYGDGSNLSNVAKLSSNTFTGRQTLNNGMTLAAGTSAVSPVTFTSSVTQLSSLVSGSLEYVNDSLFLTNSVPHRIPISGYTLSTNTQTVTAYTLASTDSGYLLTLNTATSSIVTVPANSAVGFAVGTQLMLLQLGAGQLTVAAGAGATVYGKNGLKASGQYAIVSLIKVATNTWILGGDATT